MTPLRRHAGGGDPMTGRMPPLVIARLSRGAARYGGQSGVLAVSPGGPESASDQDSSQRPRQDSNLRPAA